MTIDPSLIHPRDELVETLARIYRYRMTTTSGGNLSIKDENGDVWITPSQVDKGTVTRDDICCIRANGSVEGKWKPSSEYPFHLSIYKARPDIQAIVHAHPVALVAYAAARKIPDTRVFPQASHVCGKVGYATYELPGSQALGDRIAASFAASADCVMLENHGVVVGGSSLQHAFERFETLEFTAKTIIKASQIGAISPLTAEQIALSERPREQFPEAPSVPPTTQEKALRRDVAAFVQRGYRQRLMTATEGTLSARLSGDTFLITNYRVDRAKVTVDALTLIHHRHRPAGSRPSRAARVHDAIYRAHPGVHAIINAVPVNATAFAISNAALVARTLPESYIYLRDVQTIPYGLQYQDGTALAAMVSLDRPVSLLQNDGALVLGTSVLNAFDRLEVLETTAEAIINAKQIGGIVPMADAAIAELTRVFLGAK